MQSALHSQRVPCQIWVVTFSAICGAQKSPHILIPISIFLFLSIISLCLHLQPSISLSYHYASTSNLPSLYSTPIAKFFHSILLFYHLHTITIFQFLRTHIPIPYHQILIHLLPRSWFIYYPDPDSSITQILIHLLPRSSDPDSSITQILIHLLPRSWFIYYPDPDSSNPPLPNTSSFSIFVSV